MEITLEKIELVKDRTGVSYKDAKEALEKTEGNVVDAIILIEDTIDEGSKDNESKINEVVQYIKDVIKKGNVSKILVKRDEEVILNLPVNIGIIGTIAFPWAAVISAVAAFGTKCSIEIVKDDGDIIDVSSKANDVFEVAKEKGGVIFDEVKDRGSDAFEYAKEKGRDAWDVAKDAGLDAFEVVKEKASDVLNKEKGDDVINVSEFGDLDLSDVDFNELEDKDE